MSTLFVLFSLMLLLCVELLNDDRVDGRKKAEEREHDGVARVLARVHNDEEVVGLERVAEDRPDATSANKREAHVGRVKLTPAGKEAEEEGGGNVGTRRKDKRGRVE